MRKIITVMAAAAMALALFASSAVAGGHEWGHGEPPVPPHPHVMLVDAELDVDGEELFGTLTFRNCVDFDVPENAAPGEHGALPTPAHHHSIHTGNAGGSPHPTVQGPLFQAGNWVLPMYPFLPDPDLTGCEFFESGMLFPALF